MLLIKINDYQKLSIRLPILKAYLKVGDLIEVITNMEAIKKGCDVVSLDSGIVEKITIEQDINENVKIIIIANMNYRCNNDKQLEEIDVNTIFKVISM